MNARVQLALTIFFSVEDPNTQDGIIQGKQHSMSPFTEIPSHLCLSESIFCQIDNINHHEES